MTLIFWIQQTNHWHYKEFAVACKPNVAFGSSWLKVWESLKKTEAYILKKSSPLADAKRGDIGNTSELYAKAFFEQMDLIRLQ